MINRSDSVCSWRGRPYLVNTAPPVDDECGGATLPTTRIAFLVRSSQTVERGGTRFSTTQPSGRERPRVLHRHRIHH